MGLLASRLGDTLSGHGCFPPHAICSSSTNVFVEGIGSARVGDCASVHCCGPSCHGSSVSSGSSTVYVNGQKMARLTDSIGCGSIIVSANSTVFIGG
ncbi:PaaR repeat-containing protein [Campylobacter jejuni]|uniref:PaaR repeat-containing protein n=1 Tax=Campylobacter jejuni TaxID=197 RepID=A0A430VBH5_CAMJU|nr:PaaR repeat-containing protein [Campylobacter jejuni]RTJ79583.1 PaaR repeat-containing protein [Campylobacter jejuni]HEG8090899.1 PAAR domain-containing protein [Campylobacter jejuni]HEG8104617.1 PAAR domain-containing protein [Campylobacter jejuni]HEG8133657.1 PAAR domain-containing protein [Campylobacter jejuni]